MVFRKGIPVLHIPVLHARLTFLMLSFLSLTLFHMYACINTHKPAARYRIYLPQQKSYINYAINIVSILFIIQLIRYRGVFFSSIEKFSLQILLNWNIWLKTHYSISMCTKSKSFNLSGTFSTSYPFHQCN